MRSDLPHSDDLFSTDADGGATRDRVVGILIAALGIGWQVACTSLTAFIYYWLRTSSPFLVGPSIFSLSVYASSALAWLGAFACCGFLLVRGGWPLWWAFAAVTCQQLAIAIMVVSDLNASTVQQIGLMLVAAPCLLWGSAIRRASRSPHSCTFTCAQTLIRALRSENSLTAAEYDRCMAILPLIVTVALAAIVYLAAGVSSRIIATAGMATISAVASIVIIDLASRRNDGARLAARAIITNLCSTVMAAGTGWATNVIASDATGLAAANLIYACLAPGILAMLQVSGAAARVRQSEMRAFFEARQNFPK